MGRGVCLVAFALVAGILYLRRDPVEDSGDERSHGDYPFIPSDARVFPFPRVDDCGGLRAPAFYQRGQLRGRIVTAIQMLIQRESVNGGPQGARALHTTSMGGNVTLHATGYCREGQHDHA